MRVSNSPVAGLTSKVSLERRERERETERERVFIFVRNEEGGRREKGEKGEEGEAEEATLRQKMPCA